MVLFTVYILLVLIAFIAPKSKIVAMILFIFSFLLMALNTENPDSAGYMNEYDLAKYDFDQLIKLEISHFYLMKICNQLGFTFYQYKMVVAAVVYILLFSGITKHSKYPAFVAAIYLIAYLPLDVIQYRNILAFAIVFWGVTKFLIKEGKFNVLLYLLTVVLATTFHFSCIFYAILVFARKGFTLRLFVIIMTASVFLSLSVFELFETYIDITLKNISNYEGSVRPISVIFYGILSIISCLFLLKIYKTKTYSADVLLSSKFIFLSNVLLLVLIPILFYDTTILRLVKFWHLLTIIFLANTFLPTKNLIKISPIFIYVIFWLWSMTLTSTKVFEPVFYNNLLVQ